MILLDASQIHIGGARAILEQVITRLNQRSIDFVLLRDRRNTITARQTHELITNSGISTRKKNYDDLIDQYPISQIVSLISIPPPRRYTIPTFTYFHNLNLLKSANQSRHSWRYILMQRLKHTYIQRKLTNTDFYGFQTALSQQLFLDEFDYPESQCGLYPFYQDEDIKAVQAEQHVKEPDTFIYVSVYYPHKNHMRLLQAWQILLDRGYSPRLYLTLSQDKQPEVDQQIATLNQQGANIINLGVIDYKSCLRYTAKATYAIYPSLNESLGLGLVESQMLGCKVIAADLQYSCEVVEPSATFDPLSPNNIADTVVNTLSVNTPATKLKLGNRLDDWIDFVLNNLS